MPEQTNQSLPIDYQRRIAALEAHVTSLNQRMSELVGLVKSLVSRQVQPEVIEPLPDAQENRPAAQVGSIGREYTPELELGAVDQFLFVEGPKIIEALSQGSLEVGTQVVGWLVGNDTSVREFFILWFASHEEIRKFLMCVIVTQNLSISQARFGLLRSSLGDKAWDEIRALFEQQDAEAQTEAT